MSNFEIARRRPASRSGSIDRLAGGNPGQHRNLSHGIRELKIDHGLGYRVYFTKRSGELIILPVGGNKATQDADIERASEIATALED